jgi:hypothetical protein
MVGEIYFKQNKYKESIEAANKMTSDFAAYDYWVVKSFLLIADNFLAQKETFQARQTLNSIIENATITELVEEAKAKLAALDAAPATPVIEPAKK